MNPLWGGIIVARDVRMVRNVSVCIAILLLAAAIAGAWLCHARMMVPFALAGASTATVCALMCWLDGKRGDDGKRPLVRELVDAYLDERQVARPVLRQVPRA